MKNYTPKIQSILDGQTFQTIRGGFTYVLQRTELGPVINSLYADGRVMRSEAWLNEHKTTGGILAVEICSMGKSATVFFDAETELTLL